MTYSVIIPHKDIPDLLQRCIDSIPQREDLEVIVVDDNSSADKVDFNNFPGHNRKNVKSIFTKEGKGAGYVRNVGLKQAKGEWMIFADADDYFDTNNLNILLDKDLSDYEVVAWLCMQIQPDKQDIYQKKHTVSVGRESLFLMKEPWRKMVRRSLIQQHNISFQEVSVSNDLFFSMQVASVCKSFLWHPEIIYNWVNRENSLSSKYQGKRLTTALDVCLHTNMFLRCIGKEQYYDRTAFYLLLLRRENRTKYLLYLIKIIAKFGFGYAYQMEKEILYQVVPKDNCVRRWYYDIKERI